MHRVTLLLLSAVLLAGEAVAPPPAVVAGTALSAAEVGETAIAVVRARRLLIITGGPGTPLATGLRLLGTADPRFALATVSPWSAPRTGPALIVRQAQTGVRADRAVETLIASDERLAGGYDAAVLDFAATALPDGRRIEAPVPAAAPGMSIQASNSSLTGMRGETIAGGAMGGFPLELPNIATQHVRDEPGAKPEAPRMSPRDPRQALIDVSAGLGAIGVRAVWSTLPLERAGNAQRNWLNQELRARCAVAGRPLLDVAEILSTGPDGKVATDAEGPRLADAWSTPEGAEEACRRVARAWWNLQARLPAGKEAAAPRP